MECPCWCWREITKWEMRMNGELEFTDWLKLRFPRGCPTSFDIDDVEMAFRAGKSIAATQPQAPQGGVTEWFPIKTAPKDGSTVILGGADCGTGEGFWHDGSECYGHRGGAGWFWECDRSGLLTASNTCPTHWMPLPAAPKTEEGEKQ
jgi:hypothetical protein